MPAGTVTSMLLWRRTRPLPSQVLQGVSTILPVPPQRSQVWEDCTTPKGVRWLMRTWPVPWQCSQVLGEVPAAAPVPWHWSQVSIWE